MIAIFGKSLPTNFFEQMKEIIAKFETTQQPYACYEPLYKELMNNNIKANCSRFTDYSTLPPDTTLILSIGGDGTMLETLTIIRDSNIPIVGINTGKLGFLSEIFPEDISASMDWLLAREFRIQPRNVLEITSPDIEINTYNYALNDFTVRKNDHATLDRITVSVDNKYLNTYWADGLIISTATGSTAYSLSVGGPILVPESKSIILSPIASHNLTVRPMVLDGNSTIELTIEGRNNIHVATFDNRIIEIPSNTRFQIKSALFSLNMAQLEEHDFFKTLRNKLMWGIDKRN
ncbi:MAG: NAD kinase [Salinivirgaceae bacterium]|nr:NAD kinase [Salinivirgaceae bacterium]MDD4745962.1 NAD kinase [Salinivirgaceae bacterium]MDY0279594.1 NAD kinase [Salinivirgaceae bacterium]